MATLTIKNIPDSVYQALKSRANDERRSINSEVIMLLENALLTKKMEKKVLLQRIRARRDELSELDLSTEEVKKIIDEGRE